jgi:cyanophycinase
MKSYNIILFSVWVFVHATCYAQNHDHDFPEKGKLVLTGGSFTKEAMEAFVDFTGGPSANFVFVPSASSGIKLPSGYIWEPGDTAKEQMENFSMELAKLFKVKKIIVLHTTNRLVANSDSFCVAIKPAAGIWLGPGNAGRYIDIFAGTKFEEQLNLLLDRGGVIGGNSAGSIIQGSYVLRGNPDKPVLMARGKEKGFGFLKNFVINPHLVSAKREMELVNVLEWHPELVGFALDDEAALIISNGMIETIGKGPIYVYDNRQYEGKWWRELTIGKKYSLRNRLVLNQ